MINKSSYVNILLVLLCLTIISSLDSHVVSAYNLYPTIALTLIVGAFFTIYIPVNNSLLLTLNVFDIVLFLYLLSGIVIPVFLNRSVIFTLNNLNLFLLFLLFRSCRSITFNQFFLGTFLFCVFQLVYGVAIQTRFLAPGNNLSQISGTLLNTSLFAGFLSMVLLGFSLVIIDYLINKKIRRLWVIIAASLIFTIFVIFLSLFSSRAALLAIIVGYISYCIFLFRLHRRGPKQILLVVIPLLILLLTTFLYNIRPDSARGRILIWETSLQMIRESPINGLGYHEFEENYMDYQATYLQDKSQEIAYLAGDNRYSFNSLIRVTVEYGVLGLTVILFFLTLLLIIPRGKEANKYKVILIGWLIFSFFSYPEYSVFLNIIMVFTITGLSGAVSKQYSIGKIGKAVQLILIFCVLSTTLLISYGLYKIDRSFKNESLLEIQKTCEKFYPWIYNDGDMLNLYSQVLIRNNNYKQAIPIIKRSIMRLPNSEAYINLGICYSKTGEKDKAVKSWNIASKMIPARFKPGLLTVKLLHETGREREAGVLARKLLNKEVKVMSIEVYEILEELKCYLPVEDR